MRLPKGGIFAGIDREGKKIADGRTISDDFLEGAEGKWFKLLDADGAEWWYRLRLWVVVVCGDYPQAGCVTQSVNSLCNPVV